MNHYRIRSPKHMRLLGKTGASADQPDETMESFARRDREGRLSEVKKADERVKKYRRKAQSRG
jgi:hypothetical protein